VQHSAVQSRVLRDKRDEARDFLRLHEAVEGHHGLDGLAHLRVAERAFKHGGVGEARAYARGVNLSPEQVLHGGAQQTDYSVLAGLVEKKRKKA